MTAPIAPRILEQAATWLAQLHSGEASDADRAACARWREQMPNTRAPGPAPKR
ncbi:FecR/PupR family sigma factor regulator [Massilia aquatica]|uniref:FecR/PupR family sigma factor regulator n=1 Tax=Massilia aquatica TaxID=2609000 RepID=UPI00351D9E81